VTEEISSAPLETAPGAQIAGYQIEAEIGRGGMAIVYRARDGKLGRTVALKILAPRLAQDESFRRRFIYESQAAAAVDHPHIVPVFEAGESDGALFIAMRYVGTGDVRTLLDRQGRLPVARAVAITSQVASALDAAHARGLVHRDIKPANMLLAESADGRADHVYLSDFGLSKQSLAPTGLTSTGQFLGTLDYVAPEQIEGRAVDGRADLYALACAAVEMLTGAPPFRREENLALMWAQLSEPPPVLSERRADLPPAIDQVIAKALAKSPDDRYRNCMDFAAALQAACTSAPGEVAGPILRPPTEVSQSPLPAASTSADPAATAQVPAQPGAPAASGPSPWSSPAPVSVPPPAAAPPSVPPPAAPSVPQRAAVADLLKDDWSTRSAWSSTAAPSVASSPPPPSGADPWAPDGPLWRSSAPQRPASPQSASSFPPAPDSWLGPTAGASGTSGPTAPALPQTGHRAPGGRHRGAIAAGIIVVLCLAAVGFKLMQNRHQVAAAPPAVLKSAPVRPSSATPADTVKGYFSAINQHRYHKAWLLGGQNISHVSYGAFRTGFSQTAHDSVVISSVSGDVVTAQLTATQTDGTQHTYAGTYTVANRQIMQSDVRRVS
jgi:serine/threonine protein kinase